MNEPISRGQLNRATLARQLLLARENCSPQRAIERLCGMQAQLPRPPFVGLWSRLEKFAAADLRKAISRREIVRATLMRATLHLFSARDLLALRGAIQPALDRALRATLRDRLKDFDLAAALSDGRALFAEPHTFDDLRDRLTARRVKEVRGAAYAVRCMLPLVQVASDDPHGYAASATFTTVESWLGKSIVPEAAPRALLLRYLAAFGPASVADAQTWSGLPSLAEPFEQLRPSLTTFRDPAGRELFDLPVAPRPSEKVAAPPRLLPEFDNLVLAHDDRTRLIDDAHRPKVVTKNLQVHPTFLVDGRVAGTWKIARGKRAAQLDLTPFDGLPKAARAPLTDEAEALLRFAEPDAQSHQVKIGS